MRVPLPERLREHAQGYNGSVVEPRHASTIIVVRDGAQGVEAYLMRRQTSMAFAAGMYVFPGGGMHPTDVTDDVPWAGPSPAEWGARLGCDESMARGLVVAAVRETFEETGVLLAGPDASTVLSDTSGADLQAARATLEAGELGFGELLRSHGLVLRSDLVGAWAHWITPSFEPRRYDTRFFVAALPEGQRVGEMSREADHASWIPLREVLDRVEAGEAAMMPPTVVACREVAGHTASTILGAAAERTIRTIEPRLIEVDGELFLETDLGDPA
ncbi:NUDIX hydrolase [Aeromicrobium sp. NPDC092404]|uniref:NUDIX hydrolase n=1 Tax=Aeromicrobium sp. NPDC092404 TaxID=3154976 RepID=UPI00342AA041